MVRCLFDWVGKYLIGGFVGELAGWLSHKLFVGMTFVWLSNGSFSSYLQAWFICGQVVCLDS